MPQPVNGVDICSVEGWDGVHERRALPDCKFCDAANTLERIDARTCVCSCCGKEVKLLDGRSVPSK